MLSNSNNLINPNKSFNNVQGSGLNGPGLQQHVSPANVVHDSLKASNPLCTGLSERVSELTLNDLASLTIHPVACIPAHRDAYMRPRMLLVDPEGDYQYALSLWKDHLRHAALIGRVWWSYNATGPCTCLSEFVSAPVGASDLTPDDHATLVIRVIECIAAHYTNYIGQHMRQETLDFESEGACQRRLSQWKEHLHRANPRRLLNYAYVINVRSGHQPVCTHENKCDLLCDVNGITRCIESRIIDGEFFPHTLSAVDTMLLKLLREIIDVKYLQTPPFTSLNSQIQSWSAEYRLAVAQSRSDVY